MSELEEFKKYDYLVVVKEHKLECFDLVSVGIQHTDFKVGDIIYTDTLDLRFNADVKIVKEKIHERFSFRLPMMDWLSTYFMPYQPKFEVGDIVINHTDINIDYCPVSKGAVFEVAKNISDGWLYVTRKNVGDNTKYTVRADRFIMCNPRAYMR